MKKWLTEKIESNKQLLLHVFIITAIFVLAAHAFCFFNLDLSHDYLNEFHTLDAVGWKISIGRFLSPLIDLVFGQFSVLPWLSGLVMIVSLSFSTYLIIKMFRFDSRWQIILLAGFLATSLSLATLLASFMQDVIPDMIALLLAVVSAYQWNKLFGHFNLKNFVLSILCLFLSLGCYQGYLGITIVLIIAKSLENILSHEPLKKIIFHGLIGIAIIICGSLFYYASANIASALTGYPLVSSTTNSLSNVWSADQSLLSRAKDTYLYTLWGLFAPTLSATPLKSNLLHLSESTYQVYVLSIVNILIFIFCVAILIQLLADRKITKPAKTIFLVLLLLVPFAMNITHFLSGYSHILMHYAFTLFYLIFLIFFRYTLETKNFRPLHHAGRALAVLSVIVILINIELSNALYIKKDLEAKSTLSTITRVLSFVEATEDYIPGKTKACLIGDPAVQTGVRDTRVVAGLFGADYNSSVTYQDTYNSYLHNVLQYDIDLCSAAEIEAIKTTPEFETLSVFPARTSIRLIDDKVVVKMSD